MEKIKNLSIKKAIVLYIIISLVISFIAGNLIIIIAEEIQQSIYWKYIDVEEYISLVEQETSYISGFPRVSNEEMTEWDAFLVDTVCDFLTTYTLLITSCIGIVVAVALFYRDKIKQPLNLLIEASQKIKENKLDFHIEYQNQDELGRLCMEFERMREELERNHRNLWHILEEEKTLRAAIAHDIRTPLAVLKGIQEMLLEFVPTGILDKEKIVEMLLDSMKQIERMNGFAETIRSLSALEQRKVKCQEVNINEVEGQIKRSVETLKKEEEKEVIFHIEKFLGTFLVDLDIVLEVTENIVSNALRYALKEVNISILIKNQILEIIIEDDGNGFTNIEQVTKAYYHSNLQDDYKHFGLGMYISKVSCEKHGGKLFLGNKESGGAFVKATFPFL